MMKCKGMELGGIHAIIEGLRMYVVEKDWCGVWPYCWSVIKCWFLMVKNDDTYGNEVRWYTCIN